MGQLLSVGHNPIPPCFSIPSSRNWQLSQSLELHKVGIYTWRGVQSFVSDVTTVESNLRRQCSVPRLWKWISSVCFLSLKTYFLGKAWPACRMWPAHSSEQLWKERITTQKRHILVAFEKPEPSLHPWNSSSSTGVCLVTIWQWTTPGIKTPPS